MLKQPANDLTTAELVSVADVLRPARARVLAGHRGGGLRLVVDGEE